MTPNIQTKICQLCLEHGNLKSFATTTSVILHIMEYHCVYHPEEVQKYVSADLITIADVVNRKLGQEIYNYRIQQPSNRAN